MIKQYTDYKKSLSPFERIIPAHWEEKKLMQWYRLKSVQNNDGEELLSVYLNRGVIRYSDSTGNKFISRVIIHQNTSLLSRMILC